MTSFVPATERIPGVRQRVELQRQAGLVPLPQRVLLIGYTDVALIDFQDVVVQPTGRTDVQSKYGAGSMIDLMYRAALASGRLALQDQVIGSVPQIYTLGVAAPIAPSVAATYTLTVTGTATANGTLRLYVGPEDFTIPVVDTESATDVAARIEEFLNVRAPEMAFTAVAAAGVVTLTARHIGEWGNDLRFDADDVDAPGITVTPAAGVAGTGTVDLSTALDTSFATDFDAVVVPQYDTTTRALLKPHAVEAWSYTRAAYRMLFLSQGGDVSDAQTAAAAIDDYRVVAAHSEQLAGFDDSARSFPFETAAGVASRLFTQVAPNWNFNRASLPGKARSRTIDRDTLNDTIAAGVCEVITSERGGAAFTDPVTTAVTDQTGATTAPDTTWQPVEYAKTIAFMLRQIRIELDRFAQLPASEATRIAAIAGARGVMDAAADLGYIQRPDDSSVLASYDVVGGRTDLVLDLTYQVIVGIDIVAVTHKVRSAGASL